MTIFVRAKDACMQLRLGYDPGEMEGLAYAQDRDKAGCLLFQCVDGTAQGLCSFAPIVFGKAVANPSCPSASESRGLSI